MKPLMTNRNWLNTRAGQHLANHTIPSLTEALNRLSDILGEKDRPADALEALNDWQLHVAHNETGSPHSRNEAELEIEEEIQRAMSWTPSPLEILLFRALSRLYCSGDANAKGVKANSDATEEAYNALSYASYDFRNALTEHTWNVDGEDAERVEWDHITSCTWNDTVDVEGP